MGKPQKKRFFKRALAGVRSAATTSTTIFGNVVSEIVGRWVYLDFICGEHCWFEKIIVLCCNRIRQLLSSRPAFNQQTRADWSEHFFRICSCTYRGIQLARRLFYSFVQAKSNVLYETDIRSLFTTQEAADAAFNILDKDSNGDVDRDEMELAIV